MIVTLLKLIKKTVEAVLANSVLVSTPNKEANLRLDSTIDSTIDQFKALIEKARKFTVDNDFTVKDRVHSSSKKLEDKVEETHHMQERHHFDNG